MTTSRRGPTLPEGEQFFWNCLVAAKIIDEVKSNTATKACALYAVRKATDCYIGRDGVQYASVNAIAQQAAAGKAWRQCGLVREHVVPVSIIRERVVQELEATRGHEADPESVVLPELAGRLSPAAIALFRSHPRAWQVGRLIIQLTVMAWITPAEEARFDEKSRHGGISLRKRMPKGWSEGDDVLARHFACGIELRRI